jgi:hypothetical protein
MNILAFEIDLGVQLYDYGLFEMTNEASKIITFCYFITRKMDKTIGDVLERLIKRQLNGQHVKIDLLNKLMTDLYNRQIYKCFLHGDLTHLGNIMLDKSGESKLYFIDLVGSKVTSKASCLTDINNQWDILKSNIKSDYELDKNETKIKAIIDYIFPTKLLPRKIRSITPMRRTRSQSPKRRKISNSQPVVKRRTWSH